MTAENRAAEPQPQPQTMCRLLDLTGLLQVGVLQS